ncbi:MAG: hypothetical protein E6G62_07570, partial [Actinobacteria bacterium]
MGDTEYAAPPSRSRAVARQRTPAGRWDCPVPARVNSRFVHPASAGERRGVGCRLVAPIRARLLATIAGRAPAIRSRAPAWTLALLSGLALTDLPGVAASTRGAKAGLATQTGPVVPPGQQPTGTPRSLYRIVGCRSRGQGAYLHGPARREVAIGFDDGPVPDTASFVSMLERAKARATFFMVGQQLG